MGIKYGTKWRLIPAKDIDLHTGKAEIDEEELTYPPPPVSKSGKFSHWLWG